LVFHGFLILTRDFQRKDLLPTPGLEHGPPGPKAATLDLRHSGFFSLNGKFLDLKVTSRQTSGIEKYLFAAKKAATFKKADWPPSAAALRNAGLPPKRRQPSKRLIGHHQRQH